MSRTMKKEKTYTLTAYRSDGKIHIYRQNIRDISALECLLDVIKSDFEDNPYNTFCVRVIHNPDSSIDYIIAEED